MITVETNRNRAVRRYSAFLWRKKSRRVWKIRRPVVLDAADFWNFNIFYQKYSLSFIIIIKVLPKMPSLFPSMTLLAFSFLLWFNLIILYHWILDFWVTHSLFLSFSIMSLFYSQNLINSPILMSANHLDKSKTSIMQCQ